MSPKQHDFDWVTVRAECSLAVQFERLKADVEKNVAARSKLIRSGDSIRFELTSRETDRMFYVTVSWNRKNSTAVYFMLKPGHIIVEDHAEHEMFRASLTLNSEGECRYRMAKGEDGTYEGEYFRWQVIHRALELLFFQE